jgi:hypothetical protein
MLDRVNPCVLVRPAVSAGHVPEPERQGVRDKHNARQQDETEPLTRTRPSSPPAAQPSPPSRRQRPQERQQRPSEDEKGRGNDDQHHVLGHMRGEQRVRDRIER